MEATSRAGLVSSKKFNLVILAFAIVQLAEVVLFLNNRSAEGAAPDNLKPLRTRSLTVITPDNDEVLRLESNRVDFQDALGRAKRVHAPIVEMRLPGQIQPALRLEVTPLRGPQVTIHHHETSSFLALSCTEEDSFSVAAGSLQPPAQSARISISNKAKSLTVFDTQNRPFAILNLNSSAAEHPNIILFRNGGRDPVRIEKEKP